MIRIAQPGERIQPVILTDDRGYRVTVPTGIDMTMLWWEPQKMAKVCATCAKDAPKIFTQLEQQGVRTFGITLKEPAENAEISVFSYEDQLRILSAEPAVAEMFGVLRPDDSEWAGTPHRAAFLLDADGTVMQSWVVHHPRPFIEEVFQTLRNMERAERIEAETAPEPQKRRLFSFLR